MSRRYGVALAALVGAVAALLVAEGLALPTAWLPLEEAASLERARGDGAESPGAGVLYPLALAPAARLLPAADAHAVARALSALLWAATAIPAFLLARRLVAPGTALAVAAIAVLAPGSVYATAAVPDALAVLLAVSSLPLLARASERGSARDLAGALALATAAALARPWLVVLPFALLAAYALPRPGWRSALRWPRPLAFAGLAGAAYLAVAAVAPDAAVALASPGPAARAAAASLAVVAVGLAVVPWLLAVSGGRPVVERPEVALLATCLPALAFAAGVLGAAPPGRGLDERPLLALVPLVLALAAAAWAGGARVGPPVLAGALVVAVAALALPALGRVPSARAAGLGVVSPEGGSRAFLVAAVWVAVAVAVLLLALVRRRGAVLAAAVALVVLVGQAAAWSAVRADARALAAAEPVAPGWVDANAGPGADVVVAGPPEALDERLVAQLTLWNRAVGGVQELDLSYVDPESGQWGASPEAELLLARGVELAGTEIARSPAGVILRTGPGLRLAETVEGVHPDGWSGDRAVYRRFSGPPGAGTVVVSVARPAGGEPATAIVEAGPRDGELEPRARVALRDGEEHELEIPVPPPPFQVVVTVAPTFAAEDGRQLGAQLGFEYRGPS